MRICFDLDGTLCTGNYDEAQPLPGIKELLIRLKDEGHVIIIHTARGMNTNRANIGKVTATLAKLTLEQLDKWEFVYDEVIFGKPAADLYVDDKAMNAALIYQVDDVLRSRNG
ncbi:MAG: capsular biosynthesis protein [Magnetovibrio sp.]|nr:capsular biosynthesis protein [Magnetovibrio sp.]